jgi:alpha-1,6-mannosyltransferase
MRRTASGEHAFVAIALLGVASALLYGIVIRSQQLIAFNPPSFPVVATYVAATICLFGLYLAIVGLAGRGPAWDRRTRVAALAAPIVIQAWLIWSPPTLSIDLLSYLAHGKQVELGQSPYAEPVKQMQHTAFGNELVERGWLAVHGVSPYGPLWTWIETGVTRVATSIDAQIRIAKAFLVICSLVSAWLIWLVLSRVAPARRMEGTLLYLWNPVVIVEFAAEGHNDALVATGALLALFFTVAARPGSSLLALGSSALVKVTSLITLPPQAVLWWRQRNRGLAPLALASVVLAVVTALLYAPLWTGIATLDAVWQHGRPSVQPSTQGVIFWSLTRAYAPEVVGPVLSLAMAGLLAALALRVSLRVTDERTALRACGAIAVAYLLLAPGYWPWYATLPIALLSLSPGGWASAALVLLSLGARVAAPVERLRLNGLMDWPTAVIVVTLIGLWLPAVILAATTISRRWVGAPSGAGRVVSGVSHWTRIGGRHGTGRVAS